MSDPTIAAQIEAIARIIDPDKWYYRDSYINIMRDSGGCAEVTYMAIASDRVSASVAKARKIETIVTALRQAEAAPGVVEEIEQLRQEWLASDDSNHWGNAMDWSAAREIGKHLALARQHGAREQWQPMESAPYRTPVEVRVGHMTFEATLQPGVSMNDRGESVDQWQAVHEGEHPPCWSEGACWESNVDEIASLQPMAWRHVPAAPATDEGE